MGDADMAEDSNTDDTSTADQAGATADSTANDAGFPANTPVADMQPAEQAAYWRDKARKHEDRVKAFGGLTSDELTRLREKAQRQDALEDELASDKEKAIKDTRSTVEQEQAAKYQPLLAETAFRVAIGDRRPKSEVDDFVADLNLSRFLTDEGHVDTAKVLARVEQFAPAKGNQQRGPAIPRGNASSSGGSGTTLASLGGRDLYDRLHPKNKTA